MPKVKHICEECKEEFLAWKCQNKKFCSNRCRIKVLHRETPDKRKTGKLFVCEFCKDNFYVAKWKSNINKGKYCSKKCYWKDKPNKVSGKNNFQYIDGRTKNYSKAFYYSGEWRNLRKEIYKRDKWTCNDCGKKGGELHAHHIISIGKCKDGLDKSNIITLCRKCHTKRHSLEQ